MSDVAKTIGSTAVIVSQLRALETGRTDAVISDPLAGELVAASGVPGIADMTLEAVQSIEMMRRVYAAVVHRTWFLDHQIEAAIDAGCRQVVLVAAGLDTRAFRSSKAAHYFEIDFANMFAVKEPALSGRPLGSAQSLRTSVVADLTDPDWTAQLLAAGFDPSIPTAWVCEGILMYFSNEQVDTLFSDLLAQSAPGSRLLFVANGPGWLADEHSKSLQRTVDNAGYGFKSHIDDPHEFLAQRGWQAVEVTTLDRVGLQLGRVEELTPGPARSWAVAAHC